MSYAQQPMAHQQPTGRKKSRFLILGVLLTILGLVVGIGGSIATAFMTLPKQSDLTAVAPGPQQSDGSQKEMVWLREGSSARCTGDPSTKMTGYSRITVDGVRYDALLKLDGDEPQQYECTGEGAFIGPVFGAGAIAPGIMVGGLGILIGTVGTILLLIGIVQWFLGRRQTAWHGTHAPPGPPPHRGPPPTYRP